MMGWSWWDGCPVYLMNMNLLKSDLYNMLVKVHHDINMRLDFISHVRQMKKFKIIITFSSSNSQTKITWRVSCTIVCKVLKDPKVTFKHLKTSLTSTNANVPNHSAECFFMNIKMIYIICIMCYRHQTVTQLSTCERFWSDIRTQHHHHFDCPIPCFFSHCLCVYYIMSTQSLNCL